MNVLRVNRSREKMYVFDHAFGPFSTQTEVYNQTTKILVESVLEGYNATIFAYGPTGAGKTYTMLGTDSEPGIMALTLNDLYEKMEKTKNEDMYTVKMSYLEIYNEMIRDLLNPSSDFLDLREDHRGVQVAGLTEYEARDTSHVMEMLSRGNKERMCEPTAVNKTSSRSHAVLQVTVEKKSRVRGYSEDVNTATLFLIDLAGSERAAQTHNTGRRFIEGAHINRSLLALGNCINALAEKGSKYVNYRDSKLTRLLKDSLGGNCKTVMIAHISPASRSFEESRNTLSYADRAKNIKLKAKRNQHSVNHHVAQYQGIISELREEVIKLKAQLVETESIDKTPVAYSADRHTIVKLKDDLKTKFQEQLYLRKEMIDLEDSSLQLAVEYQRYLLVTDEWEQEQMQRQTQQRRTSNKNDTRQVRNKKPRRKTYSYDPYDISAKDDFDDEKSSTHSRHSIRSVREPADVTAAREELDHILQQQDEVELRKKEVADKLERRKHENFDFEENMLRQATNDHQREIIKNMCFLHEYQIRNMELESMALMKEFLLQQKDIESQRSDVRRRLIDEVMRLQKDVLTGNKIKYPNEVEELHHLYKEQVMKDTAMLSALNLESKRYGSKVPTLPSIMSDIDSRNQSPQSTISKTSVALPKIGHVKDRNKEYHRSSRVLKDYDRDSMSSRQTVSKDNFGFPTTDTDQYSDADIPHSRKAKKINILNNINNMTNNKHIRSRRDTFVLPLHKVSANDVERSRGRTFRVNKPETEDEDKDIKEITKKKRNSSLENEQTLLKESEFSTARKEVEGRKRSASAGMIRDKKMRDKLKYEKLLTKRNNIAPPIDSKESKPTWNNHFGKKGGKLKKPGKSGRIPENLPTLKKAKILTNGHMLIGYQGNGSLAVSGTSFTPKNSQPGFGRI